MIADKHEAMCATTDMIMNLRTAGALRLARLPCVRPAGTENGRLIFDVSPFLIKINHKNEIMPKNEI